MSYLCCIRVDDEDEFQPDNIEGFSTDGSYISIPNTAEYAIHRLTENIHILSKDSQNQKTQVVLIFQGEKDKSCKFVDGIILSNGKQYNVTKLPSNMDQMEI